MILYCIFLFLGLFTLSSLSPDEDLGLTLKHSHRRQKRLVFGVAVLLEDEDQYSALSYQSTIVSSHFCNEGLLRLLERMHPGHYDPSVEWKIDIDHVKDMVFTHCPLDETRAYCGGAAITEYAVQTACHCISRFDKRILNDFGTPSVFNGWEDLLFLYVGALKFSRSYTPYVSKNFILHQRCQLVANTTISHNLGIIVLRYKLQAGTKIAGPTTMEELAREWYYMMEKQAVCLVVGWGSAFMENSAAFGLPSYELRRSWRVVRSFLYCYETHSSVDGFMEALNFDKAVYKDMATWSCTTDFGKFNSKVSTIDSGSPLACVQGWYFGVSAWAMEATANYNTSFTITTDTDIIYAFYENSWEYRPSFNRYIDSIKQMDTFPKSPIYARQFAPNDNRNNNRNKNRNQHRNNNRNKNLQATYRVMNVPSQSGRRRGGLVHSSSFLMLCFAKFLLSIVNYNPFS